MGKADSTLVAASFKEAMADVPADLKDVYDKNEEAFKIFSESVDQLYKEVTKEEREKAKETREQLNIMEDGANAMDNDAIAETTRKDIKAIRDKINDPKTSEEEKARLRREVARRAGKLSSANDLLTKAVDNSADILFEDPNTQEIFNNIIKDINENGSTSNMRYDDEKKDYVFGEGDKALTLRELENKIGFSDIKIATDVNKKTTTIANSKQGMYKDANDASNVVYDDLNGRLNNPNDILSAFTEKGFLGMESKSVKDLLENRGKSELSRELYDELKKLDFDGDGEADATFATPQNYKALVDKINSDSQLKKEVIAKTVSAVSGKHAFETMQRLTFEPVWKQRGFKNEGDYLKSLNPDGLTSPTIQGYEYIKFGNDNLTGNVALKVLNDMPTGRVIDPQNDDVYNWKGDGWYFDDKLVAKNNDAFAKDVLQVRDQRFYGIPNPTTTNENNKLQKPVNDIINYDFIKMTEEDAENYLKNNLPEGFTFDQYGIGDAIKVMYGDKSVKVNLQPNTTGGENANIKKLQDFIKEVLGKGKYD